MKIDFQPSSAKANNLRLQHPHFGHLSASAAVRLSWLVFLLVGSVVQLVAVRLSFSVFRFPFSAFRFSGLSFARETGVMGALRHHIALVISNILFGVSFSVYVSLLHGVMRPEQLFVLQLLFSLFIFTPLAVAQRGFFRLSLNDFGSIFIVALLVVFGWWYLLMQGASYTNPIDASTITVIGPIFTLWTSIVAHSRRAVKGEKLGLMLALVGVMVILVDRGTTLVGDRSEGYGNALVLCAVVAISVNTVLIAPVLRRCGTVVVMGWYYLVGTLLSIPLIMTELPTINIFDFTHLQWVDIGYILIFGSVLPMFLLYKSSEHLTAVHNALYHYIQPILATLFAVLRGQAKIDRTNIFGAVLIFIGMLCVTLSTPRREVATRE